MKIFTRILQPRGLLVAMHLPFVAFTVARSVTSLGLDPPGIRLSALPLVLIAGALQVRHSLAAADGVSVARSALHDLRDITYRQPAVSLASELNRCSDILAAVGVETRVTHRVEALPPRVDELFAWAVREGVTNVVRHSTATTCSISIGRDDGHMRLEIENDGAGLASVGGQGLSDLVARSAALSGRARGQSAGAGRFLLTVDVPEEAS